VQSHNGSHYYNHRHPTGRGSASKPRLGGREPVVGSFADMWVRPVRLRLAAAPLALVCRRFYMLANPILYGNLALSFYTPHGDTVARHDGALDGGHNHATVPYT
jgi:hypothetical protein